MLVILEWWLDLRWQSIGHVADTSFKNIKNNQRCRTIIFQYLFGSYFLFQSFLFLPAFSGTMQLLYLATCVDGNGRYDTVAVRPARSSGNPGARRGNSEPPAARKENETDLQRDKTPQPLKFDELVH